jgi:hypothetical protein
MKAALLNLTFFLPELELIDQAFKKGFDVVCYLDCKDGGGVDKFTVVSWKEYLAPMLIEFGSSDVISGNLHILRGDCIEKIKNVFLKNGIVVEEFDVDDPESMGKFEAIPEII